MKILTWLKPEKLIYLLPALFPLYLVKVDLGAIPSNLLEIATVLLFMWQLLVWIIKWPGWKAGVDRGFWLKQFLNQQKWFLLYSAIFVAIILLSTAIVPTQNLLADGNTIFESRKVALGILKGWMIVPYMYFTLLWFGNRSKANLFASLYAYIFSALPLVIWAFYQYATGDFITMDARASGPFINANYLAMYLAPAVVALWILITRSIVLGFKLKRFIIGVILAALYSIALLMTQSYGAMLSVIVTLLLFFVSAVLIHKKYQKTFELDILKRIGYFLATFALITILSAILLFANTEKWKSFTNISDRDSTSVRLQVYQISETLVLENPLLGIGLGQFQAQYDLNAKRVLQGPPYEYVMIHPHNTLLAVWLNLGIVGMLMFIALVFSCLRRCLKSASYEDQFYRLIGVSMLLVMFFHGLVDTYLFKNDLAFLFWMIVAFCLLPRNYVVMGVVEKGAQMGQKLGFPTANLNITESNLPLEKLVYGIYGTTVKVGKEQFIGALSYGARPTVDNDPKPTFEVHLLNYEGDLYDQKLKIEIWDEIRGIFKFKDLEELRANIQNDLKEIRQKIRI